jgi:hypothetical protein
MKIPENKNKILDIFKQGPNALEEALEGLSNSALDYHPSKGGWTIRQIVHHIVDGDDIWKYGIKMAFGNEKAEFNLNWYWAHHQTEWSKYWNYEKRSIVASLALLKANRDHILQLLEITPESWGNSIHFVKHNGDLEIIPVGAAINIQADHVFHHVKRILEIRNEISDH